MQFKQTFLFPAKQLIFLYPKCGDAYINIEIFDYRIDIVYNKHSSKMSMFSVGDKVIYPNQGIGIIEDIQVESYFGQNFRVYHLRILSNDTLVMVPSANTEEIGIRKLVTQEKIEKVFDFMKNGVVDVPMNWKGRYKEHVSLMKTGSILDMAVVLKSLYYLNLTKPLSFREKKMMEKAKELLVTEISEVSDADILDIERQIFDNLSVCFAALNTSLDS